MYHEIISGTIQKQADSITIRTGWYSFYHKGAIITGNVVRVGETVSIRTLLMGNIEMNTLSFIDSNPQRL